MPSINEDKSDATAPLAVNKLVTKSHSSPDELRTPNLRLPGFALARLNLEPGWRWSECIKPVVKTELCQVPHIGYVVSGSITLRMSDGTQKTISAGESYAIPPGHDAWVEGNERCVAIEVLSAEQYAK